VSSILDKSFLEGKVGTRMTYGPLVKASRDYLAVALALLMAFQTLLLIPSSGPAIAGATPIPSTLNGLIVSGDVTYNGGSAVVTGSIYVLSGAKLTLNDLNITMDGPSPDSLTISVQQGGSLFIHGSLIKALDPMTPYLFVFDDGSTGLITNSTIMNVGSPMSMSGVRVVGRAAFTISSSTIMGSYIGIIADGSGPTIEGCTISDGQGHGILAINKARPVVANSTIMRFTNGIGIYLQDSDAEIRSDTLTNNRYGLGLYDSQAVITGTSIRANSQVGFYSERSSPTVTDSSIMANMGDGLVAKGSTIVLDGTTISENKGKGMTVFESTITMTGAKVDASIGKDISLQGDGQTKSTKVTLYGTTYGSMEFPDPNPASVLEAYWDVAVKAVYQSNGKAVQGATVWISDSSGTLVRTDRTDGNGAYGPTPIMSFSVNHAGKTGKTPHTLTVSKGLEKQSVELDLSAGETEVTLTFDDIRPWINLDPIVQVTNQASVTIGGLVAPDTEHVLVNGGSASLSMSSHRFTAPAELSPGTNVITIEATDHVGNSNNTTAQVLMDVVAPLLQITSPANPGSSMFTNIGYITIQGRTEPSATLWVDDELVGQSTSGLFECQKELASGTNVITVTAKDLAGNVATMSMVVFYDPEPPILQLTAPRATDVSTNQRTLVVSGDVNDPGARVVVTLNGADSNVSLYGMTFTITLALVEGTNQLSVKATDEAGNTAELTRTVVLDTIAPQLAVDTPQDDLMTSTKDIMVSGMTDEDAILTVGGAGASRDGLNFEADVGLTEGRNVIEVVARDEAGNSRTVRVTVICDATAPTITLLSPKDGLVTTASEVMVEGYVSESAGLILNGHAVSVDLQTRTFGATVALQEGTNHLNLVARDAVGNMGQATITVTRDSTVSLELVNIQRTAKDRYAISGRTDPDASLTINGVQYPVEPSGFFKVTADIKDGSKVIIEAKDPIGNTNNYQMTVPKSPAGPVRLDLGPAFISISLLSVVVALGYVGGTERGKLFVLFFLFVPLYSRMKKNTVLDHYVRGQIHGYIVANPGDHYNSIKDALKLNNGTLAYHIRVLEREGIVKSRSDGIYKRFYPADMKVPENDGTRLTEIQKIILKRIKETPSISQKEMSRLVGVSPSTINYHIDILKSAGLVRSERRGMRIGYFLEDLEVMKKVEDRPVKRPPASLNEDQKFDKDLAHHDFSAHDEEPQDAAPGQVRRISKKAKAPAQTYNPNWEDEPDEEN